MKSKMKIYTFLVFANLICMDIIQYVIAGAMFYHEPSQQELYVKDANDFGFAMAYQEASQNLVVGAPTANLAGKVFSCDLNKTASCYEYQINFDKLAPYQRDKNNYQGLHTGSHIVTTKDYIFTCAPLWTHKMPEDIIPYAYGTCFLINDKNYVIRYNGTVDVHNLDRTRYQMRSDIMPEVLRGGTGWLNMIDEENELLLIIKTSLDTDFIYGSKSKPWDNTISLRTSDPEEIEILEEKEDENIFVLLSSDAALQSCLIYTVVAGKFFSEKTVYAFSFETVRMRGVIAFLQYDRETNFLSILHNVNSLYTIKSNEEDTNSMFGAAMAAANLNYDRLAELLVGAPAQSDIDCIECGVVYIYLGGEMKTVGVRTGLRLLGTTAYSRFGSAIAACDLDGDHLQEIVVSAPYESDGAGAVYVFAGFELNELLTKVTKFNWVERKITNLKYMQKITPKSSVPNVPNFGFSLLFLSDLDNNGCNELAVGSPGQGKVTLLKCLPQVKVSVSTGISGNGIVTEKDKHFTVEICPTIEIPQNAKHAEGTLVITNEVNDKTTSEIAASDSKYEYSTGIMSSDSLPIICKDSGNAVKVCAKVYKKCKNVTVTLKDNEPHKYQITTKAELRSDHILNNKDFSASWIVAYKQGSSKLQVIRQKCEGEDCLPRLSMHLDWVGGLKTIIAGETASVTANVVVHNEGGQSFHLCVKVTVKGAQKFLIQGDHSDTYYLPNPFNRNQEEKIEIVVDTSTLVNLQKELQLSVDLYENCDRNNLVTTVNKNVTVPYEFKTGNIIIKGGSHRMNALTIKPGTILKDNHEYMITNGGSVLWKDLRVSLFMNKTKFITSFDVLNSTSNLDACIKSDTEAYYNITCFVDLMPKASMKLITPIQMIRLDTMGNEELNVTSTLELHLTPTHTVVKQSATTVVGFEEELSFSNKKWLVTLIAVLVAVAILLIIVIVLYKFGFFKRKQKERTEVLRTSIKRRNSRRGTITSAQGAGDPQGLEDIEMEIEDDSPFDDVQVSKIEQDGSKNDLIQK